ncbi:Golgin imh1 [Friedmanniomyces endolithicus]|nr:Golgin imh1 [Friedmanniomyces endolithicus]
MFNRLKGFNLDSFLDGKIAEEQAKQGKPAQSPSPARRTPSNAGPRRGSARTASPAQRGGSRLRVAEGGDGTVAGKGPDPEEFVIGDDASDISRAATPKPVKEKTDGPVAEEGNADGKHRGGMPASKGKERAEEDELPEDVRKRLAKLESLTAKYQDLLRNYRTAHTRVSAIEPFEATLREHTPLTSIANPEALVEFLNQRSVQSEMVLEELKRISVEHKAVVTERDELKGKLEEAEKKAKDAFDEAAGLREERESANLDKEVNHENATSDPLGVNGEAGEPVKPTGDDDDFFSYDAEQKRTLEDEMKQHLAEIHEQKEYINELSTENATLRKDFDMCELNLKAMENKVGVKERHLAKAESERKEAREQFEGAEKAREEAQEQEQEAAALLAQTEGEVVHLQEKLKEYQKSLQDREQELQEKAALAEENLKKYQDEHAEHLKRGTYAQRDEKGMDTLRNLVKTLRAKTVEAEKDKEQAQGQVKDLQHELKKLESEATVRGNLLVSLRDSEAAAESYKRKLAEAESERDEAHRFAETKKGHEAAVASLRSQLKNAVKERDAAYQMILDCGKCKIPGEALVKSPDTPLGSSTPETRSRGISETTERTETSAQPTEASTPSISGETDTADAKKKSKPKKKPKSKMRLATDASTDSTDTVASVASPSVDEMLAQPEKAGELLLLSKDGAHRDLMSAFIKRSVENAKLDTENRDEAHETVLRHHERAIEERDQTIRDGARFIKEKDEEIARLSSAIAEKGTAIAHPSGEESKSMEELEEEIEMLKGEVLELGGQATGAKHELMTVKEQKAKLQEEYANLQMECDKIGKSLKDAEAQRQDLSERCRTLETEIVEVRSTSDKGGALLGQALDNAFQEHMRDEKEIESLRLAKATCEKEIEEHEAKHKLLSAELETVESRAAMLVNDLAAATELAQTRFKDLTDLRNHLKTVQPELKQLREEAAELKSAKADLAKANSGLKRLESKEKDLRSEIAEYKSQAAEKDGEITSLRDVAKKSDERSSALEDSYETARKDLEQSQSKRDEATEAREKLQADLKTTEEDLKRTQSSLDELEKQVKSLRADADASREEVQMTRARQASAQSLMDSQQDQSRELAIQMRELRERNESLEEELADAHRLLSERSREGETMRRMLGEVEARAEARVKEMRERMDLAVEERDRAEDEASTVGRRKARELEEVRGKLREAELGVAGAREAREEVERREQQLRERQEGLEKHAAQALEELREVKAAMAQLRDTIDESERQTGVLEREKAELKKDLEDRQTRLEKLQKSTRSMSEELRGLQSINKQQRQGSIQSSRSSLESTPVASPRITSPPPRGASNGTPLSGSSRGGGGGGGGGGSSTASTESIDYRYLKNVLLQFLEQKEKKHQMQLVPVLGMLLHFDKQDQLKWEAAVAAR